MTGRRIVPYALLGSVTLLAIGAAALGASMGGSSPAGGSTGAPGSSGLQSAVGATEQASSFTFRETAVVPASQEGTSGQVRHVSIGGSYQAPDRWAVGTTLGGNFPRVIEVGRTEYFVEPGGRVFVAHTARAPSLTSSDWLPILNVPPIGVAGDATDVQHHGSTYTFVVPTMELPPSWVAYSPQGLVSSDLPRPSVAKDTPVAVVVRDGYIVSLSFPRGFVAGADRLVPSTWSITRFGSAPPVVAPSTSAGT
jgi:hypothetical protein